MPITHCELNFLIQWVDMKNLSPFFQSCLQSQKVYLLARVSRSFLTLKNSLQFSTANYLRLQVVSLLSFATLKKITGNVHTPSYDKEVLWCRNRCSTYFVILSADKTLIILFRQFPPP
jgi:hypothetical protein